MAGKQKNILAVKGKRLTGKVVSISNAQTVIVEVFRVWRHPIYKKAMRRSHKYAVHVIGKTPEKGKIVLIAPCVPISKRKHFILVEKVA